MLPSSSSPVESAVAPVALPVPAHQGVGGSGRECHQPPGTRRGGDPPDLCASEVGQGEVWSAEIDCASAGGCCKGDQSSQQAGCDHQMEEAAGEGGAWGPLPHSGNEAVGPVEGGIGGTVAILPDLCDTSGGHTRLHLSHDLSIDLQQQSHQCHSSPKPQHSCSLDDNTQQLGFMSQKVCEHVDVPHTDILASSEGVRQVDLDEPEGVVHESVSGASSVDVVICGEKDEEHSKYSSAGRTEMSVDCSVRSKDWSLVEDKPCGPAEEYLVHDTQRISLVACGVTQCEVDMAEVSAPEEPGLSLITYNLHHSSHPMFDKWPCYFYITQERLPTFSIDSHGRHIGSEAPMFFPGAPSGQGASGLSEEEQVKMAKRMGLIMHLPCGTFDETKKSGECVICMIDFSVGDKVRYLPCMHTYHTQCIDDWLMRSFTCPSCLEPVDAALLNTYGSS